MYCIWVILCYLFYRMAATISSVCCLVKREKVDISSSGDGRESRLSIGFEWFRMGPTSMGRVCMLLNVPVLSRSNIPVSLTDRVCLCPAMV